MYHFRVTEGSKRSFANITITNLITGFDSLSLATARLKGIHPPSISELSDRAYYIIRGIAEFTVGSETFEAKPEDAVFVPRGTPHSIKGDTEYVVVNVPPFNPTMEKSVH